MNALRHRNRVFRNRKRRANHLRDFRDVVPQQQGDVRPRYPVAVAPVHGGAYHRAALANSGIKQPFFPAVVTTWEEWLAEHPDTTVLSNQTGYYRAEFYVPEDNPQAIYYDYFTADEVMFPVWLRDPSIEPKRVVVGVLAGEGKKAYVIDDLREARVVNDTVGGVDVVIAASGESRSARAYVREGETFSRPGGGWEVTEDSEAAPRFLVDSSGYIQMGGHRGGARPGRRSFQDAVTHSDADLVLVRLVPVPPRHGDI